MLAAVAQHLAVQLVRAAQGLGGNGAFVVCRKTQETAVDGLFDTHELVAATVRAGEGYVWHCKIAFTFQNIPVYGYKVNSISLLKK